MPSKKEKERRKRMRDSMAAERQAAEEAAMPISKDDLRALFEHLDQPNPAPCSHTLRETLEFLEERGLDPEKTVPWLQSYGGFCDCEVIFNVTDVWEERVGWSPDLEDDEDQEWVQPKIVKKPWWKFW
jgi:hypothetical protein